MREFRNPTAFIAHLVAVRAVLPSAEAHGLDHGARIIEEEAKQEIGTYQSAAGPFAAWAELTDRTKADRAAQGYPANTPELRDGTLLHSIGHSVEGRKAVIGSNLDVAVWQEVGTSKMPPRSFLGGAAVRKGEEAADAVGKSVAHAVAGLPLPIVR